MKPFSAKEILIADDNPVLLSVLTQIFQEAGWVVRTACDGFGALSQIRKRVPEILLSDLNMGCMSGFELLSVVRRRYPLIPVIAMSGSFTGSNVPHGVAADSFYAKGASSVSRLLEVVAALATNRGFCDSRKPVPIYAPRVHLRTSDPEAVLITCPECLRPLVHSLTKFDRLLHEVCCWHCLGIFELSIVQETCAMDMSTIGACADPGRTDCGNITSQYVVGNAALAGHP